MSDLTAELMRDFAIRTGLSDEDRPPTRYLWTDAFAVCNYLGLAVEQRDDAWLRLARALVDQTHRVLGRHRADDPRRGWISGLGEEEGARHPTAGGLRIGKPLPERGPTEPFDPELEWERDGQYFHYLTKWMQALWRVSQESGDPICCRWAVDLARTANARFAAPRSVDGVGGLYWKMSIDLSRPQVPSMGQHDPLDGLLTFQQLQSGCGARIACDLSAEIGDMAARCAGRRWETDDPLGLGGLLCDAWRLAALLADGTAKDPGLLAELLDAAARGLEAFLRHRPLDRSAESRLAFRELGLSIGLHAARRLTERLRTDGHADARRAGWEGPLRDVSEHAVLAEEIERFWRDPGNRRSATWTAHRDINEVMLATSLAPGGFLGGGD